MINLSLVPAKELREELDRRTECFICAWKEKGIIDGKLMWSYYGSGNYSTAVGLSSFLNNDVLNNWNGELRYLEKITEENEEE